MPKRTKLTNSSDESEISSLVSGDKVFVIPYFQRPYRWKPDKLEQLNDDILNIIDSSESHFLGAIIIHGRRTNPADPNVFEIIDGQQRITTLLLYLAATVRLLCLQKEYSEAAGLFLKYLAIARETRLPSNIKLHPCKEDRAQINYVYSNLLSSREFKEKLGGVNIKLLPSTGKDRGTLRNNYNAALRFMKEQFENEGLQRIRDIYEAILEQISVVQIDVWDPTNGPKIFDGLNSRQEPMTIGDLVRNEIFSRVADEDASVVEQIDEHKWQPFYEKFKQNGKNYFDAYFFPFGLVKNSNLKKSEVYNNLRDSWEKVKDPAEIIETLSEYQNAFIDITCGKNLQSHKKSIATAFSNLTLSGAPSSTYPFLMQLSNSIRNKDTSETVGLEILDIVESFLVRRAICGHEPTGLHAVFKKLWTDCSGTPTAQKVVTAIKKHKTVVWPTNDDFKLAIESRPLYGSTITPYVLLQYDRSLGGDAHETPSWVEHVLPEKPTAPWFGKFSKIEHDALKDTLANLIPLTGDMNRSLGNKPYATKRVRYKADSVFKSARQFALNNPDWTPARLAARAKILSKWAITRWK